MRVPQKKNAQIFDFFLRRPFSFLHNRCLNARAESESSRQPEMHRLHLRSDLGLQRDADLSGRRLRAVQVDLGLLGRRRQAHRQPAVRRGSHRLCELR